VTRTIHGIKVNGVEIDRETRCAHYSGANDVIAIKFKCCGNWYPCHECHAELAGHTVVVWPKEEFATPAILCGACGYQLTARDYLDCDSVCPRCRRQFNPGCADHRHFYFES
jgi:uncharacterized CHY-type Zn-finger protein